MRNPDLDHQPRDLTPSEAAGMLLAVREHITAHGESWVSDDEILAATGASAAEAHEIKDALLEQVALDEAAWLREAASLKNEPLPPPNELVLDDAGRVELALEVLRFVQQYPGSASSNGERRWYADCFRQFVLELRHRHADVATAEFAAAIDLPLATLEDWQRGGRRGVGVSAHEQLRRASRKVRARRA